MGKMLRNSLEVRMKGYERENIPLVCKSGPPGENE